MIGWRKEKTVGGGIDTAITAALRGSYDFMRLDLLGKILDVNDSAAEFYGTTPGKLIGKDYADTCIRPKDNNVKEFALISEAIFNGETVTKIAPRLDSKGKEVWADLTYTPLDQPGKSREILVIARQITDMHMRRRDNRSQTDAIRRSMGVIEFALDGTILDANDLFLQTTKYSMDELRGKHHRLLMPSGEADRPEYSEMWKRLAKGGSYTDRVKRRDKFGDPIWLRATYETLIDPEGRPFKVVKYAFDVTDDMHLQADVSNKIEAIGRVQAVIEFDTKGTIRKANENFCKTLGYEEHELIGKHHRIFMKPGETEAPSYEEFWKDLARGEEISGRFHRIGKGGKDVFIRASYNPIRDAAGKVTKVVKFAIDMTDFELATGALQNALDLVADGDLTATINTELGEFNPIRDSFNATITRLNDAIDGAQNTSRRLEAEAAGMTEAVDSLANRTERQAATLEQSAASLDELTQSLELSRTKAAGARDMATEAKDRVEASNSVVQNAMGAMDEIAEFSEKISTITKLIDDISFQTNLLALNAGVEAARAGDAGRGFAVVASEVRSLAHRSSEAAKEISGLLSSSSQQVKIGVDLVKQTGQSLAGIRDDVQKIHGHAVEISSMTEQQSVEVGNLNSAVSDLDRVTQQNAAMAEEANASFKVLLNGVNELRAEFRYFEGASRSGTVPYRTFA